MLIPISYNLRSLFVRRASTTLTVLGMGTTVAIVAGVHSLQQGFQTLFTTAGREDVAVLLRPGATSETASQFSRDRGLKLIKTSPEFALGEYGEPLASMECYLGALLPRLDGNSTNVPIRGVQPATFEIRRGELEIVEGRNFAPGSDEMIVGRKLTERIQDCQVGGVLQINTTPFRVVGVFSHPGSFESEVWGDLDRVLAACSQYGPNRVIAKVRPGVEIGNSDSVQASGPGSLAARLETDREVPAKVMTEREFLESQTRILSTVLLRLGAALAVIMGIAAVFTATNTMLSALAARTHEIGILLATGFRPFPVFLSFLLESLLLGLIGGAVGCLMTLPINGVKTATMNAQTFTEIAFAFRVTPRVLVTSVLFALALGLLGGALPAWRAARLTPTEALRRH
ncbi:MAG TPA: ABC transporter permease [Planctomycetota bacterium]|nr:ABC transporter permease [Planctomycetota bacterium]